MEIQNRSKEKFTLTICFFVLETVAFYGLYSGKYKDIEICFETNEHCKVTCGVNNSIEIPTFCHRDYCNEHNHYNMSCYNNIAFTNNSGLQYFNRRI